MALYHLGIFDCKQTQMPSHLSKGRFEIIRMHCGDEETIDWTRISLEEPGKLQRTKKPNADPGWTREQSDETTTTVKRKLNPSFPFLHHVLKIRVSISEVQLAELWPYALLLLD